MNPWLNLLLLIDNVEHLVQECAELVQHLLLHCRKLTILVTGREALFIEGEITLQIPSLSLPQSAGAADVEIACRSEGVQLFVARAQAIRPDFELTQENAAATAEVVNRLDGIPLALELAASRLRMLSVEQIAARLNDRFRLLTGGRRTALPRQQTLQALIDWSWNLLVEKERILLRRISVFSGSCSLDAAQEFAQDDLLDEYEIFDTLEQLINKSLITVTYPQKQEARYGMLESIRQYGSDRLLEAGEGQALRDRHAQYYLQFAKQTGPNMVLSSMLLWIARIELELDNLRSVISWTQEDQPEIALSICAQLLYTENNWLHPKEACTWLKPTIENVRSLLVRDHPEGLEVDFIRSLVALCIAEATQGNMKEALIAVQESIDRAHAIGAYKELLYATPFKYLDQATAPTPEAMQEIEAVIQVSQAHGIEKKWQAMCLGVSGFMLILQGDIELGEARASEAFSLLREFHNPRIDAGLYRYQSMLLRLRGDLEGAKKALLISIENYEKLKSRQNVLRGLSEMAHLLRLTEELEEAKVYYRKSLAGWLEFGHQTAVAHDLECMAYIAISQGEYAHAAQLLGATGVVRSQQPAENTIQSEVDELNQAMDRLAKDFGQEERDRCLAEGANIPIEGAVSQALSGVPTAQAL